MNNKLLKFLIGLSIVLFVAVACDYAAIDGTDNKDLVATLSDDIDVMVQPKAIAMTAAERNTTAHLNDFAFDFFNQIKEDREDVNFVISPLSAAVSLGLTASGAAGNTASQILSTLGLGTMSPETVGPYFAKLTDGLMAADPYVQIALANGLWADKSVQLKESFKESAANSFAAEISSADFSSPEEIRIINDWVSQKTGGLIPSVLDDELHFHISMALVNAIAFRGLWRYPFPVTEKGTFQTVSGNKQTADMMKMACVLNYAYVNGFEFISLPYGAGSFTMCVVLPPKLASFKSASITNELWGKALEELRPYNAEIQIPSFRSEYSVDLISPLKAMGITDAFSATADFSPMVAQPVYISDALQKTYLEVDDKGTTAASSTVEVFTYTSPGKTSVQAEQLPKCSFYADRPFFFVLSEQSTGAILFVGQRTEV
ncbi:MAG: serpin family protein [Bacteroidales bacterium]|nr:serpin family protein [Bacteroidales bacterium]